MESMLFVIFVAPFVGLLVCVLSSVVLWAVLGQTYFVIRLSGLLLCVGAVGAFSADNELPSDVAAKWAVAVWLLMLVACIWLFKHWLARGTAAAVMVVTSWFLIDRAGPLFFDPQSYAAAAIAVPMGASLVLTFRLLGFRFIRLTGNVSDTDIEVGTGMNFDAWLELLRSVDAERMTRAEIVTLLRERGVPFTYQRVIADAYELSIGRRILLLAVDGTPQTVVAHSQLGKTAWQREDRSRSRWSVRQLLVLSVVAAGLFALARALSLQVPDAMQLGKMATVTICCGLIAVPLLAAELSVQGSWPGRAIYLVVASIASIAVPQLLGLWTLSIWFSLAALSVLCYTAWLIGAAILVRHHGYRIVLVGRPEVDRRVNT